MESGDARAGARRPAAPLFATAEGRRAVAGSRRRRRRRASAGATPDRSTPRDGEKPDEKSQRAAGSRFRDRRRPIRGCSAPSSSTSAAASTAASTSPATRPPTRTASARDVLELVRELGADDHALPRRQLRLRLQLGGRRRPGRGAPAPARPRLALDRAQHVRHQRVHRLVPRRRASSRCWRSTSAPAAGDAARNLVEYCNHPGGTALVRPAPRATAGRSRTASSSGASATRWTAPGRWSTRPRPSTAASPPRRPR